jgi:hypothetical protein
VLYEENLEAQPRTPEEPLTPEEVKAIEEASAIQTMMLSGGWQVLRSIAREVVDGAIARLCIEKDPAEVVRLQCAIAAWSNFFDNADRLLEAARHFRKVSSEAPRDSVNP